MLTADSLSGRGGVRGSEFIIAKQLAWARSRNLPLVGSQGERGRRLYVTDIDDNLFAPLLPSVRQAFISGDGNELGSGDAPGKMQALHSSSALGVNVFQYWASISDPGTIAAACRLCRTGSTAPSRIRFEAKLPVASDFGIPPNIDVLIENDAGSRIGAFGVECKFSEAYGSRRHSGLRAAYLSHTELWRGLDNLRALGSSISPDDNEFEVLHAAQLVKHTLGLTQAYGHGRFRLLYLWYDVLGPEGAAHRGEVERFGVVARADGVLFHSMTYQELIVSMSGSLGPEHAGYIDYLAQRYV